VGNLRRYAQQKAEQAIRTGERVVLPHMNDYERFIVHDALKDLTSVKSASYGEGENRHIEIEPDLFGRGLKRIIKKIRLF
jgi:predicted RNA-binding protein Jag